MREVWYTQREFYFKRDQILWFIENFAQINKEEWKLVVDTWPSDPDKTALLTGGIQSRNPLEVVICIVAELNLRLERTGKDGQQLLADIKSGATIYEDLTSRSMAAIDYISSGEKRRKVTYKVWLAQRNYYKKYSKKRA